MESAAKRRPTIADVAAAANVSVATVNRVLNGAQPVRKATEQQVVGAAEQIGFYAARALRGRPEFAPPARRFGFLMQQPERSLYQALGRELTAAAQGETRVEATAIVEHRDDLSPQETANRLLKMGRQVDAIAVVAADHPYVTEAIVRLQQDRVPVVAVISDLTAASRAGYVGLDCWKLGATAGWAMARLCKNPGKVAMLVGNHRYLCQDISEIRFRSYFRDHAPGFQLLDAIPTFEDSALAYQRTLDLIHRVPDLVGLFVAGGGKSGVLRALRDRPTSDASKPVVIVTDLTPEARAALLDGVIDLILSHPMKALAEATVNLLVETTSHTPPPKAVQRVLPFEIYTLENL
jgi:LacI family transcriptional regulator